MRLEFLAKSILSFWFGDFEEDPNSWKKYQHLWFKKDPEFDKKIASKFGSYLEQAYMGAFDRWLSLPLGGLALSVLLDQFPRNIFRDQAKSYAYDAKAITITQECLKLEHHMKLPAPYAYFLLMPLMHSERLEDQDAGLAMFKILHSLQSDKDSKDLLEQAISYSKAHRDIICEFGRFPHRNKHFYRESTLKEKEFLKLPGSSF